MDHVADCPSYGAAKIYTGDEVIQSTIQEVFELFRRPFLLSLKVEPV